MPDNVDEIISALPEENRESITSLVGAIREELNADIQTLKGQHGEAVSQLKRSHDIELASLRVGADSVTPTSAAGNRGVETLEQVRARHQREDTEAQDAKRIASLESREAALAVKELDSEKAVAKADGVPDSVLQLVDTAKELSLMRAVYAANNGNGTGASNAGNSGTRAGISGSDGNNNQGNLPPDKMGAGLKVLESHGVDWNS